MSSKTTKIAKEGFSVRRLLVHCYLTTRTAVTIRCDFVGPDNFDLDRVVAAAQRRQGQVRGDPSLARGLVQPLGDDDRDLERLARPVEEAPAPWLGVGLNRQLEPQALRSAELQICRRQHAIAGRHAAPEEQRLQAGRGRFDS